LKKNENIGVHSICNFSTNIFWGQGNSGRRRNAEEEGEMLTKVSPEVSAKFFESFVSSKFH